MSEWIEVKDKLPSDKQEIKFKGKFPFECAGFYEKSENGYAFFHLNKKENKIYHIYGVTHWMSLPEPPKDENSNT